MVVARAGCGLGLLAMGGGVGAPRVSSLRSPFFSRAGAAGGGEGTSLARARSAAAVAAGGVGPVPVVAQITRTTSVPAPTPRAARPRRPPGTCRRATRRRSYRLVCQRTSVRGSSAMAPDSIDSPAVKKSSSAVPKTLPSLTGGLPGPPPEPGRAGGPVSGRFPSASLMNRGRLPHQFTSTEGPRGCSFRQRKSRVFCPPGDARHRRRVSAAAIPPAKTTNQGQVAARSGPPATAGAIRQPPSSAGAAHTGPSAG